MEGINEIYPFFAAVQQPVSVRKITVIKVVSRAGNFYANLIVRIQANPSFKTEIETWNLEGDRTTLGKAGRDKIIESFL